MNEKIREVLSIERQLAGLDETKEKFKTHPANLAFFNAEYKVLKLKRAALMKDLSTQEKVEVRKAIKKIRERPNTLTIAGCEANVGPTAGVTLSGIRFAFIPSGPIFETRVGPDGKLIEKKLRD